MVGWEMSKSAPGGFIPEAAFQGIVPGVCILDGFQSLAQTKFHDYARFEGEGCWKVFEP